MRTFYLDTSAVNHMLSCETAREDTTATVPETQIMTSVLVVAELASTSDAARRSALLRMARGLLDGARPFAMPGELLRRSLECVSRQADTMPHSIDGRWDDVWAALNEPDLVTKEAQVEALSWKKQQEDWYLNTSRQIRPVAQKEMNRRLEPGQRAALSSFVTVIRSLSNEVCREVAFDLARACGSAVDIDDQVVSRLLTSSEHWRFFLVGLAHAMHARAVSGGSFGPSSTPGWIDSQQSIYLAACNVFVTGDHQQFRMLRRIAPFGHIKRQVWRPERFTDWLRRQ